MMRPKEPVKDSYFERYRDYFNFLPFANSYEYRIEIENYYNNKQWPLVDCPKCNSKLNEHPPRITNIKISLDPPPMPVILMILAFCSLIPIAISVKSQVVIISIIFFLLFFALSIISSKAQSIRVYLCSKCGTLIYNNFPRVFKTKDTPKQIFEQLEHIPGFKLK